MIVELNKTTGSTYGNITRLITFIHSLKTRNSDFSHIFVISKNAGGFSKSASFRGNLAKCDSFHYVIVFVFDANNWDVL